MFLLVKANNPVATTCHASHLLVGARVLEGLRATCYHSVAHELKENGARHEDAEVVVDSKLLTSRQPGDLPAFVREMLKAAGAA